jgi:AraC-like DNA-binding protein
MGSPSAVGYTDPSYFSRAFRRWAGVTPRSYRKYRLAS